MYRVRVLHFVPMGAHLVYMGAQCRALDTIQLRNQQTCTCINHN